MFNSNDFREMQVGMFATHANVEQVIENYNVKGEDVAIIMITVNTVLEMLAQSAERLEKETGNTVERQERFEELQEDQDHEDLLREAEQRDYDEYVAMMSEEMYGTTTCDCCGKVFDDQVGDNWCGCGTVDESDSADW